MDQSRWSQRRFFHPRKGEPGKAYTFAAGVIEDVFGFDPTVFNVSPREAEQMDPQQRLALQLVWEAFEEAGIPPSSFAGSDTGVYVGASALDYGARGIFDQSSADPYFMLGNTLSIVSNRVSYAFDLHGPSFTVDTACSSSLVALNEAMMALDSGRIESAVVLGVNILTSPLPFIGFSQASMLSPTGRCRAFDAGADGYVRAEGGVALILRRADAAQDAGNHVHARILGAGINSDGRTVGMSLPSADAQVKLLRRIYEQAEVSPADLAFIEAHGTGTRVGDPAEAFAVGNALGKPRSEMLPVGSVKTNVGHLEAASGLVGMLKAMLALEHDLLPASLHLDSLNPDIPFEDLKLRVAVQPVKLADGTARAAGVNSFGFGGTNAHVIIADPEPAKANGADAVAGRPVLAISARSREALTALAASYSDLLADKDEAAIVRVAASVAASRDLLSHRLVMEEADPNSWSARLASVAAEGETEGVVLDTAVGRDAPVAFAFSGNGSQWAGMGRAFSAANGSFRRAFAEVDEIFAELGGWSMRAALADDDLAAKLKRAEYAQPLLFATQVATTAALADLGVTPSLVFGHSVGEVAAAHAAGALSLADAVNVIHKRSHHQEIAWKAGTMAAVLLPVEDARALIADSGVAQVEIAAVNSGRSLTVSGPEAEIRALAKLARSRRVPMRVLELDYPFHTALIDGVKAPLLADLQDIRPLDTIVPFASSVTGAVIAGRQLDADYWWENVRQPVRFADAAETAIGRGARVFVEIGPRAVLQTYVGDALSGADVSGAVFSADDHNVPQGIDPARRILARVLGKGGAVDRGKVFGALHGRADALPTYPWQNRQFNFPKSMESAELFDAARHPLIGFRGRADGNEWNGHLDAHLVPALAEHKVGGRIIVPGSALIEMALAAGRCWLGSETVELLDFEIPRALVLDQEVLREVKVRISPESRTVEILSRPRLREEAWTMHAMGRIAAIPSKAEPQAMVVEGPPVDTFHNADLYDLATQYGLDYGRSYRAAEIVTRFDDGTIEVTLRPQDAEALAATGYGIDPGTLDSSFHGLFMLFKTVGPQTDAVYLPARFGEVRLYRPGVPVARAQLRIRRASQRTIKASFVLVAVDGSVVATLDDCRFRAAVLSRRVSFDRLGYHYAYAVLDQAPDGAAVTPPPLAALSKLAADLGLVGHAGGERSDDDLLLEAFAVALAHQTLVQLCGTRRRLHLPALIAAGELAETSLPLVQRMLALLQELGHATVENERWQIARKAGLPAAGEILRTVVAEHPARVAETVFGARAAALMPTVMQGGPFADLPFSAGILAHFLAASPASLALAGSVGGFVDGLVSTWPASRPLRILEIGAGAGALTRLLAPHGADPRITLTVTDPDETATERLRFAFGDKPGVELAVLDLTVDSTDVPAYDLVVSAAPFAHALPDAASIQRVSRNLAEGGTLALAALLPTAFTDVIFGIQDGWFARSLSPEFPIGRLRSAEDWSADLGEARFGEAAAVPLATESCSATLVLCAARRRPAAESGGAARPEAILVSNDASAALADALASALEAASRTVHRLDVPAVRLNGKTASAPWGAAAALPVDIAKGEPKPGAAVDVVDLTGLALTDASGADPISARLGTVLALSRAVAERAARLWILAPGALQGLVEGGHDAPEQAAVAGFVRVLTNETRGVDLRLLDVAAEFATEEAAAAIVRELGKARPDTEVVVTRRGVFAPRLRQGLELGTHRAEPPLRDRAVKLNVRRDGGIDDLAWDEKPIGEPQRGEVSIDIAAAGLNFRDVMWSLGLLPEEALEDGFAGPELGIEGAGTIVSVGAGVKRFKAGDRVITFASGAFASRVTVPEVAVAPLPEPLDFAAGATIPVTFLTAYYALHHLARLRKGEWLLVHGGAGGVGLAALQIAQWRGAKTIATAGSEEKRQFLRMLGADHVFSSRSLDFVDQVRALTGDGVDVVLNSLAGEQMERSIGITRPFGRFLELGKRDYYANSRIGLRPFRRNVSYFGIDADQLLLHRRQLTETLFGEIVGHFRKGTFSPLPHRVFASGEVKDAFRLMQQSGHIGKIVVEPPPLEAVSAAARPVFRADPNGTHLIVGGLGGFGMATAEWLVERGARHLVLVGRSGAATQEACNGVAHLERLGATVHAAACDASDAAALGRLLTTITKDMPPLKGVMHAAMVLDDTLIENLDAERVSKVLRPKVEAASNLDRLTRGAELDYFILFSSATTVVGNPGQANYVAANAYLESLARRRRSAGLPALAVAWGALEDVGFLAREAEVREKLARKLGQAGITAREGLEALARILAEGDGSRRATAMLAVSPIDWGSARRELRLLGSPVYAQIVANTTAGGGAETGERVDLAAVVKGRDARQAREAVADILVGEVARILKLPSKEIGSQRPLAELGMDSLMGLELRMSVERRFGIELPLVAIGDTTTLTTIATAIVSRVQDPDSGAEGESGEESSDLARRHLGDGVSSEELSSIEEAVRVHRSEQKRII